jgi:hypothetical protein
MTPATTGNDVRSVPIARAPARAHGRLRLGLERQVQARPAWALLGALVLGLLAGRALRELVPGRPRRVRRRGGARRSGPEA